MADLGSIGKSTSLGQNARSVGPNVFVFGKTTQLGTPAINVPNLWSGSSTGKTTRLGLNSYSAGPNTTILGKTTRIGTESISVPNFWVGPATIQTTVLGRNAYQAGPSTTIAGRSTILGTDAISVPNFWVGSSTGHLALFNGIGFKSSSPISIFGLTTALGIPSIKVTSYGAAQTTGHQGLTTQFGYNVPDPISIYGATTQLAINSFNAGPNETIYGRTTTLGEKAAELVPSTITLFLRDNGIVSYGVNIELTNDNTLLQVTSSGTPISPQIEIESLLGVHSIRASIFDRTVYISIDNILRYTYTDTRPPGPTIADSAGKVGFQLQNMCIDTFYSVIGTDPPV